MLFLFVSIITKQLVFVLVLLFSLTVSSVVSKKRGAFSKIVPNFYFFKKNTVVVPKKTNSNFANPPKNNNSRTSIRTYRATSTCSTLKQLKFTTIDRLICLVPVQVPVQVVWTFAYGICMYSARKVFFLFLLQVQHQCQALNRVFRRILPKCGLYVYTFEKGRN